MCVFCAFVLFLLFVFYDSIFVLLFRLVGWFFVFLVSFCFAFSLVCFFDSFLGSYFSFLVMVDFSFLCFSLGCHRLLLFFFLPLLSLPHFLLCFPVFSLVTTVFFAVFFFPLFCFPMNIPTDVYDYGNSYTSHKWVTLHTYR